MSLADVPHIAPDPVLLRRTDLHVLEIAGADAIPFLQTKLTSDTRRWATEGGGYGIAVDINGAVVFDGHFCVDGTDVLCLTAATPASIIEHLDRYVVMEDVVFTDRDADFDVFALAGAGARTLFADDANTESAAGTTTIGAIRCSWCAGADLGTEGTLVVVPGEATVSFVAALGSEGVESIDDAVIDAFQIRNGIPRFARDFFAGETIPLEAGLWHGVSLGKGCYLGQEVIERLFSRGNPSRRLVRVSWTGDPVGARHGLVAEGRDAGFVTSAMTESDRVVGMAWVRRRFLGGDATVTLEGSEVVVLVGDFVGGTPPDG